MEPQKGHHPHHGRPSSSQDYRYPPPSTHPFPPGPGSTFHHPAYTASFIAAGHPEQQQQQASVLQQREVIARLPSRMDNRSYQQADPLAIIPGNMDTLDQQRTEAYKKQALAVNPYFYHPNFAVTSAVAMEDVQSSLSMPKACPPNLVVGSAIAMDNAPSDNNQVVAGMDVSSTTSSPSTCASLQTANHPEATVDLTANATLSAQREAIIAESVKEPSAAETAELLRLKYAPKANSLIQTLLRKGGQLPDRLSYDQFSSDPNDVRIVATKPIEQGTEYGPLKGNVKTLDILHNTQAWELCLNGVVAAYIAPTPRKEWMGYIRNARFPEECNLEAGQVYGRIHFTVTRRIEPGSELRVFYSDLYRENCGFMYDLAALKYSKDEDYFSCTMCNVRIDNCKSMVRHYKLTHPDDGLQEEKSLPLKVAERLKLLNAQCKLPPQYEEEDDEKEEEEEGDENRENTNEATEKNNDGRSSASKVQEKPLRKKVQSNQSAKRKMQDVGDSQRFICPTCGKNFPTHGRLVMHESFHDAESGDDGMSGDDNGMCEDDNGLSEDDNGVDEDDNGMDDDIREDIDPFGKDVDNGLRCPICGFVFHSDSKLAIHQKKHKTHHHMCRHCGNLYTRKAHLYRHLREAHGGGFLRRRGANPFLPNYKPAKAPQKKSKSKTSVLSNSASSLNRGKESKNAVNRCSICNFLPRSQEYLKHHIKEHRGRPYGCEKCGLVYAGKSFLFKHLRLKHGASKEEFKKYLAEHVQRIRCKECGFTCHNKRSLQEHRKIHRGASSLSEPLASLGGECCQMCGFKTIDQARFDEHKRKHDTNPFGCRKCGNTYASHKSLIRHHREKHETQHVNRKQMQQTVMQKQLAKLATQKDACPFCAFYTSDKPFLQRHISKHQRFPHGCIECGHVYTRNSTLLRHQREKHFQIFKRQVKGSTKEGSSGLHDIVTVPDKLQVQGNSKHMQQNHPDAFEGNGDMEPKEHDLGSASDSLDDGSSGSGDDAGGSASGIGENHPGEFGYDYYGRDDRLDGEERFSDREEAEMEGEEEYSDDDESVGNEDEHSDEEEDERLP